MTNFRLILHKTYYGNGIFNVRVDWDHLTRADNGPVVIELPTGRKLRGNVDRDANLNGTARVFGGVELRNWFQRNYEQGDTVMVEFVTPTHLRLRH